MFVAFLSDDCHPRVRAARGGQQQELLLYRGEQHTGHATASMLGVWITDPMMPRSDRRGIGSRGRRLRSDCN